MEKIPGEAKSRIVPQSCEKSQQAILHFRVKDTQANKTWVEINLETGRTHQIRLQLSHFGHPILGDSLYGSTFEFGPKTFDIRKRWIALHARQLGFVHPISKQPIEVVASLPHHWNSFSFEFAGTP